MIELLPSFRSKYRYPAGDIGVGAREVGYMAGMMKKLSNDTACVFTGKGISFGGSLMRPEATGYGTVYFAEEMLKTRGQSLLVKPFRYLVLVTLRSMLLKSNVLRCKSGYAYGLKWYRLFKKWFYR